jgi:hypothetical protein
MNKQSNQHVGPTPAAFIPLWGRPLAIATAVVYLISLTFPVIASLSKNSSAFPKWWGVLDVGLAFVLAILAFVVYGLARGKVNKQTEELTYRAYRILIHGIFILILIFFILGDRVIWINGLPGIAWRAWLLLYILPEWFTVTRAA